MKNLGSLRKKLRVLLADIHLVKVKDCVVALCFSSKPRGSKHSILVESINFCSVATSTTVTNNEPTIKIS